LTRIHSMYFGLLVNGRTSFTDMLVWSIMVNRHDLAKEIWRYSVLPVHAALVASHLYHTLATWFEGSDDDYPTNATWFETQATKVLDEMEYDSAKKALEFQWKDLQNKTALQIAEYAEAKSFMSNSHVQRYIAEVLYTDKHGRITAGTNPFVIISLLFVPFWGPYKYTSPNTRFYHVYHLPVIKFWSSTLAYFAFLILLAAVLVQSGNNGFFITEFILWAWLLGILAEEVRQFLINPSGYFESIANIVDFIMLAFFVAYFLCRVTGSVFDSTALRFASTDILIVATIWAYVRLLYIFAFSKTLGPLCFAMMRMNKDVLKWIFVFAIFMVSFQLGVMALTLQAGQNMLLAYPTGSFAGTFFTIVGDFQTSMSIMAQTNIGVILLGVYAFIAQVILVNLLIAMMGNTYSDIQDNSDKEWKFFRYQMVFDYTTCSAYPPPLNLVIDPVNYLFERFLVPLITSGSVGGRNLLYFHSDAGAEGDVVDPSENSSSKTVKEMKTAKESVLESEEEDDTNSIQSLSKRITLLSKQREADRIFLEQNLKSIQELLTQIQAQRG